MTCKIEISKAVYALLMMIYEEYADHSWECPFHDDTHEGHCDCGYDLVHRRLEKMLEEMNESRNQSRKSGYVAQVSKTWRDICRSLRGDTNDDGS